MNSNLTDIQDQTISATISTSSWSGSSAPYTCKISNSKILANSNVDINLASSASDAQALSFVGGAFVPGVVAAGSVTIKAYGKKPKVDLPIMLLIHGKERV